MTILLLAFLYFLLLSASVWAGHQGTKLVERDGLWYYPFHNEPLSGRAVVWHDAGQYKMLEINYKDGKQDGAYVYRWKNGQKIRKGFYKDGKKDGIWVKWDEYGNITR